MIGSMKTFWRCLFSPRLYKIYRDGMLDAVYQPHSAEKWGDTILASANTLINITLYTSPFICFYVYKRGFFTYDECNYFTQLFGCLGGFLAFSLLVRAFGRLSNPKYMKFLRTIEGIGKEHNETLMSQVRNYDFDFTAWPVSYEVPKVKSSWLPKNPFESSANADLPYYQQVPIQLLAYIATHTFALRLIYPGSLGLIHNLLWSPLMQGRAQLVENFNGSRSKLKTADGNDIDTMFVDNRSRSPNGSTLVICCEGNSGFYEVGIMMSPIKTGYSALGWNHPGFAGSTGLPYPSQEHNAIDVVMQYAINKLNYSPENIVMYGWSIGGYSAAWAAVHYPIKGLMLDATFDDLLPLAQNQMPASWSLLVKEVVRSHVDLHVANVLKQYKGPVHLIRRTDDEIISLRPGDIASNRGNYLVLELIKQREPDVIRPDIDTVQRYANCLDNKRSSLISPQTMEVKVIIRTLRRYMTDFRSSHCTPLPEEIFASCMNNMFIDTEKIF